MTNRQDVILLDCDGVLVDFATQYLKVLEHQTDVPRYVEQVTNWNFHECVATKEQDAAVWKYINGTSGFVYDLPWYPGAQSFLRDLRKLGRVVACTTPANPKWTAERAQWLLDKAGFAKRDIVVTGDKSIVAADFLIDDHLENLDQWGSGAGMGGFPICMARPWNDPLGKDIYYWQRCHTFDEVLETVRELRDVG